MSASERATLFIMSSAWLKMRLAWLVTLFASLGIDLNMLFLLLLLSDSTEGCSPLDLGLLTITITAVLTSIFVGNILLECSPPTTLALLESRIHTIKAQTHSWGHGRKVALRRAKAIIAGMYNIEHMAVKLEDHKLQSLATHLARALLNYDIKDCVKVFYKPLHPQKSATMLLPNGKVAIFIDLQLHHLRKLTYTTSLVSLILRELCLALLLLELDVKPRCIFKSTAWLLLGETGYGPAWLELAAVVQKRAIDVLNINGLDFEMKRLAQKEYATSGIELSQEQIERVFSGANPIVSSNGKWRRQTSKQLAPSANAVLIGFGIFLGMALWTFGRSLAA